MPQWNILDSEVLDLSLAILLHDKTMPNRKTALYHLRKLADFRSPKGSPKDLESKGTTVVNTVLSRTANLKNDPLESSIDKMIKALKERKWMILFESL